jgi:hypothetical protein
VCVCVRERGGGRGKGGVCAPALFTCSRLQRFGGVRVLCVCVRACVFACLLSLLFLSDSLFLHPQACLGLQKWSIEMSYLSVTDLEGLKLLTGKTWLWSTHKLLGHESSMTTQHSKHGVFKTWIETLPWSCRTKARTMLQSLGPLVGDRFWAVFKNAACMFGLRLYIQRFLDDNLKLCQAQNPVKNEDNHSRTVRTISCLHLAGENVAKNQMRIMVEVKVYGILHFAIMAACLHVSSKLLRNFNGQRKHVNNLHGFFIRLLDDPEFCRQLFTMQADGMPLTFLTGEESENDEETRLKFSSGHLLAYRALCQPTPESDSMTEHMLRVSVAHMTKKQLAMSSDLVVLDDDQRKFSAKPANSKRCESSFGYLDYRRRFCQYENIVRTNGITMWRLNDVAKWIKAQPRDYVKKLFQQATNYKYRTKSLDFAKERAMQTSNNKADFLSAQLEIGRVKMAIQLAAMNVSEMWQVLSPTLCVCVCPREESNPPSAPAEDRLALRLRAVRVHV